MERGWSAKGLLKPLWERVGGRDKLAALSGITPQTLSAYNSGARPLGTLNARRIAAVLKVSVLELGAPEGEVDGRAQTLLDRQAELEASVLKLTKQVNRLARQVAELKRRAQSGAPSEEAVR